MVEQKADAGRSALGAWMNRCKAEVGDVGVGTHLYLFYCRQTSCTLPDLNPIQHH